MKQVQEIMLKVVVPLEGDWKWTEDAFTDLLHRPGGLFDSMDPFPDLTIESIKTRPATKEEIADLSWNYGDDEIERLGGR